MGALAKHRQTTDERKRYVANYAEWLEDGETLTDVDFEFDPASGAPVVDGSLIAADGLSVSFFVSGGDDGETYQLLLTATTSGGQVKQDYAIFTVNNP